MMSDEEKKAIEYIKNCLDNEYDFKNATRQKDKKAYNIILNLIKKQSKEIEELKEMKKELTERVLRLESDKFWDNVVSNDKIKVKIEELKKECENCEFGKFLCKHCFVEKGISILQSLKKRSKTNE